MKACPPNRIVVLLVLALSACALCLPVAASAVQRVPLEKAASDLSSRTSFKDTIVRSTRRMQTDAADSERVYTTADGYSIEARSNSYDDAQVQAVVDVVDSLEHGPELAELSIFVANPGELARICGAGTLACYAPGSEQMIVSGDDVTVSGVPRNFVIAHEYGHHLANNRIGGIWAPIEAGTARWATRERVCQLTRRGDLFPGNETDHYWQNPGEAFAESFAHLNFPENPAPWGFTSLIDTDPSTLAEISADVSAPWVSRSSSTWTGTIDPVTRRKASKSKRVTSSRSIGAAQAVGARSPKTSASDPGTVAKRIALPLDGTVTAALTVAPGDVYTIRLRDPKTDRVLDSATADAAGIANLEISSCGRPALRLEVQRIGGGSDFGVAITTP